MWNKMLLTKRKSLFGVNRQQTVGRKRRRVNSTTVLLVCVIQDLSTQVKEKQTPYKLCKIRIFNKKL